VGSLQKYKIANVLIWLQNRETYKSQDLGFNYVERHVLRWLKLPPLINYLHGSNFLCENQAWKAILENKNKD